MIPFFGVEVGPDGLGGVDVWDAEGDDFLFEFDLHSDEGGGGGEGFFVFEVG